MKSLRFSTLLVSAMALTLTACGGGGGGSTAVVPPTTGTGGGTGSSGPTYTAGTYVASSTFKNMCESPRAGTDDVAGSLLEEKHWLRSWSNETYLWYSELPDIDPASSQYPTAVDYFDVLKTSATTASGAPKDRFHFSRNTAEYQQQINSGASAGYGVRWRIIQSAPPRDIRVAYVEAGSPAETAGLARGDKVITIDGQDAVNGNTQAVVDALNGGLFPNDENEQHNFTVEKVGATDTTDITMTSGVVTSLAVHTTGVETLGNGDKVGYLLFNTFGTFPAEDQLYDAMTNLSNEGVKDLVLDLRYNGGGYLYISSQLGYMIAGPDATRNQTYEQLVYNDKIAPENPTPFYTTTYDDDFNPENPLPSLDLDTVYILSTGSTCSASESLLNGLRGIDVNVVLIGTTTCGKPYGFRGTDNCGTTYFTIQFRGENAKGFGDYADGFSPSEGGVTTGEAVDGCILSDDFTKELGDPSEALYNAALTHIQTGACPTTAAVKPDSWVSYSKPATLAEGSLLADPRIKNRMLLENSRIFTGPGQK